MRVHQQAERLSITSARPGQDGGDVALERDRDQAAADLVLLNERDVGGLERRVARLDGRDQANLAGWISARASTKQHLMILVSKPIEPGR